MFPTRRFVLRSTMAMAPVALAKVSSSDLIVSSSKLTLEINGDPQRPTLALRLPHVEHPSILIEMPEHAWWKKKTDEEPVWFYKMYSADPALHGKAAWVKTADALSYRMETPSGFTLQSTARLESDGLAITHTITSPSIKSIAEIQAPTCIKLYRPFNMFSWSEPTFTMQMGSNLLLLRLQSD